jgi:hypothetical protein
MATVASNLLVLDLCMAIAFTTVLIAATLNVEGDLSIDEDQASWLGMIWVAFVTTLYRAIYQSQVCGRQHRHKLVAYIKACTHTIQDDLSVPGL